MSIIELIGVVAGSCTTLAFIPQLRKVILTRSTADISLLMYTLYCSGLALWTIYGVLINSISLILANFITLLFALGIVFMKIKFDVARDGE